MQVCSFNTSSVHSQQIHYSISNFLFFIFAKLCYVENIFSLSFQMLTCFTQCMLVSGHSKSTALCTALYRSSVQLAHSPLCCCAVCGQLTPTAFLLTPYLQASFIFFPQRKKKCIHTEITVVCIYTYSTYKHG